VIELLPALPAAWPAGEVKGLKARGAVTVGLRWEAGKAAEATLRPEFGGEVRLRVPAGQTIKSVAGEKEAPLRTQADGSVAVMLEARRSYRVHFA